MKFTKPLCTKCTIDGDCCCQRESQTKVNGCGMEEVLGFNANINIRGQNYNNPDYAEFIEDRH